MKICEICGTKNTDNARFCRECGKPQYKYNAVLDNVNKENRLNAQKGTIICTIVGAIFIICGVTDDSISETITLFVFACFFIFIAFTLWLANRKDASLEAIADFIVANSWRNNMCLFKKNGKMGLLKCGDSTFDIYKIVLPAEYDFIQWQKDDRILEVILNGETYLIDKTGLRLKQ